MRADNAGHKMTQLKTHRNLILSTAGLLLASCSSLPNDPGLYAVSESGTIQRLSGGPQWDKKTWGKRGDLPSNLRFFVVQPGIASDTSSLNAKIRLKRAGWVRSDIAASGVIGPAGGAQWIAADIESLIVPLTFDVLGKRDNIVVAAPYGEALQEGLYILELKDGDINVAAKFGVSWTAVNKSAYASDTCIDRYQTQGRSIYRRCAEQQQLMATQGLKLHIVEPERRTIAGLPAIVIKGIVLNESDNQRTIPTLEGRLVDADGRSLYNWRFQATTNEVAPGKSVSFGAVVEQPPPNVSNVVVRFADIADNQGN